MTLTRALAAVLTLSVLVAVPAFAGKQDAERLAALEQRIAALEAQLEERIGAVEQHVDTRFDECVQAAVTEIAQREQRAQQAYGSIVALVNQGQHAQAKVQMTEFMTKYAGTEAAKRSVRLMQELQVVGKPAPDQLDVEKWFTGDGSSIDLSADGTSLIVFWEEWCPHCKREVPKLKETWAKYHGEGLNILGLTKVTKSSTEDKVTQFIATHGLEFPMAKERGGVSSYFGVSGIPAAAVVKDGEVIWRGHPAQISDGLIESWLSSSHGAGEAGSEG